MHARAIAGKALIYGLANALGKVVQVLTLPIFTRYLTTEDYGTLSLLVLVGLIGRALFSLGLGGSVGIVYFEREDQAHRQRTVWLSTLFLLASAAAMIALALPLAEPLAHALLGAGAPADLLRLYCVATALQLLTDPLMLRLQFEGQAGRYLALSLSVNLAGTVASLALVVLGWGLGGWVIGAALGALVSAVVCLAMLARGCRFSWDRELAARLMRIGLPMVPSGVVMYVLLSCGPFFLKELAGLREAGLFAVGAQFALAMSLVANAFGAAWVPFFLGYATRPEEGSAIFPALTTRFFLGFGLLAVCFFAFAEPVVGLFTAPSFHGAAAMVGPLALAYALLALSYMLQPGMYFAAETKLVMAVQGGAALVSVAAQLLLVPRFGMLGAALAVVAGTASMVALQAGFNRWRRYPVRMCEPGRLAAILLALLAALALHRVLDATLGIWALSAAAALGLYGLGGWSVLRADERRALLNRAGLAGKTGQSQ